MDKMLKRIDEGKCLICKKVIDLSKKETHKDYRGVIYKGRDILICRRHKYVEEIVQV